MTYDARETSLRGGEPIRLYDFSRGIIHWRYCSADRDTTDSGEVFSAVQVSDDGYRQSGQSTADLLNITVPWNLDVLKQFRGVPPSVEIGLTIKDLHFGDTQSVVQWVGSIQGVTWPQPGQAKISCQSIDASFDRPGLGLTWSRTCPYTVFDVNCTLNRDAFKTTTLLQTVTATTASSGDFAGKPDGYFNGGYIEWSIGLGELERRAIESHIGSDLVMFGGTDGIAAGISVQAFPGCRNTTDDCTNKFGNEINYGGEDGIPGTSPFDGERIF